MTDLSCGNFNFDAGMILGIALDIFFGREHNFGIGYNENRKRVLEKDQHFG